MSSAKKREVVRQSQFLRAHDNALHVEVRHARNEAEEGIQHRSGCFANGYDPDVPYPTEIDEMIAEPKGAAPATIVGGLDLLRETFIDAAVSQGLREDTAGDPPQVGLIQNVSSHPLLELIAGNNSRLYLCVRSMWT